MVNLEETLVKKSTSKRQKSQRYVRARRALEEQNLIMGLGLLMMGAAVLAEDDPSGAPGA